MNAVLGRRRPRLWPRRSVVAATVLVGSLAWTITAAHADAPAKVTQLTLPTGARTTGQAASINAVACSGLNTCVAVGSFRTSAGNQPLVVNEVNGVWSAGRRLNLPSGAVASTASAPNRITELLGVACPVTGGCVAVGTYDTAGGFEPMMATEVNGVWRNPTSVALPSGAPGTNQAASLNAISCAGVGNCVGVGTYAENSSDQESWSVTESAGTWSAAVNTPLPSGFLTVDQEASLNGVSCHAAGDCTAVGTFVGTVDALSDDEAYVVTSTKGTWNAASAVAIALPDDAAATGTDSFNGLNAVSCPSVANCVAVGQYATTTGYVPLAVTESAGVWSSGVRVAAPVTSLSGTPIADLIAIDCSTTTSCEAVGGDGNQSLAQPLRATQSEGVWSAGAFEGLPSDAHVTSGVATGQGFGVHCFVPGACLVVGAYLTTRGTEGYASTPATPPNPPTNVLVASRSSQVTVSWTPPGYVGGGSQSVTSYTATLSPGGESCSTTALACTLTGLTNGVSYVATVTATNAIGTSVASAPSTGATPAAVPDAPVITRLRDLHDGFQLTLRVPDDNGAAIVTYEFSLDGGAKWRHRTSGTTSRFLTITGLASKHAYRIAVRAVNRVGPGLASPVVTATTK